MPSIALVTPSFQQGRYLAACIDSVLGQGYPGLTYFVSDGGSTDESVAILRRQGERVRWRSGPDGGQVHAVNAALRETTGEVCGFLNSDDLLEPGALARVAAVFAANPEVDVVYGRAWFITETDQRTREYPVLPFAFDPLVQHCFICQPATFWRRRVHERFGWFDPSFDNTFDYEFWLRLAAGGAKFLHLPEFLACSREHPATKSQRNRGHIFAEIRRMQLKHLGYVGRNWWEQQIRYWRDESGADWGRLIPGKREARLYGLAWWPYVLWRRRLGGPLFYRPGDWRA